jgi:single-strand DNA-binding protein
MSDTNVTVVGNCTSDPDLRISNGGNAVLSFSVAVNVRRKNKETNQWENGESSFFDVVCFGQMAENVASSIYKGKRVMVIGTLRQSSWEKDGQKRSKVEVVAEEVGVSLKWDSLGSTPVPRSKPVVDDEPF